LSPYFFGVDVFCTNAHGIQWMIGAIFVKFSPLIFMKIIKIIATRKRRKRRKRKRRKRNKVTKKKRKRTKFNFGWGSAPDPAGGAYSAPQTP